MLEASDDILALLPARLKAARQGLGLSLDAVAKLSGVSRSMVSQIERGESSPTISTLWNLTRALQVDFAGLLEEGTARPKIQVLRSGDVPSIENMGRGCVIRILSPPEDAGQHEIYDISFSAGGALLSQPHARGVSERIIVLDGSVDVRSDTAEETLRSGDTALYAADVVHAIVARDAPARVLLSVLSD